MVGGLPVLPLFFFFFLCFFFFLPPPPKVLVGGIPYVVWGSSGNILYIVQCAGGYSVLLLSFFFSYLPPTPFHFPSTYLPPTPFHLLRSRVLINVGTGERSSPYLQFALKRLVTQQGEVGQGKVGQGRQPAARPSAATHPPQLGEQPLRSCVARHCLLHPPPGGPAIGSACFLPLFLPSTFYGI